MFSPHERRPSLGRTMLNCIFFFLYLLIFILCVQGNRFHGVFEVIGGDLVSLNYWYYSKYGIPGYAHNNWYQSILISVTTTPTPLSWLVTSPRNLEPKYQSLINDQWQQWSFCPNFFFGWLLNSFFNLAFV